MGKGILFSGPKMLYTAVRLVSMAAVCDVQYHCLPGEEKGSHPSLAQMLRHQVPAVGHGDEHEEVAGDRLGGVQRCLQAWALSMCVRACVCLKDGSIWS